MELIDEYKQEKSCEYKGDSFLARDNGAILRLPPQGKKPRKNDNVWTFGTKNLTNGYMFFTSSIRVHSVIAYAFHGKPLQENMVVDHIDTNRCNNRPENLRWVTRLENVLNNPITRKKIAYLCGSIEAFLENPRILDGKASADFAWMRTVSKEDAEICKRNLERWAEEDSIYTKNISDSKKEIGEWIFNDSKKANRTIPNDFLLWNEEPREKSEEEIARENEYKKVLEFRNAINDSLSQGALQTGWSKKLQFPLCPSVLTENGLEDYAKVIERGKVVCINEDGIEVTIKSAGWTRDWDAIQITFDQSSRMAFTYLRISIHDGKFLHTFSSDVKSEFMFSLTPGVLQCAWGTPTEFPLCSTDSGTTLKDYAARLTKGALCERNTYLDAEVYDSEIGKSEDGTELLVVGVQTNSFKKYSYMTIFQENGKFIHQGGSTFFDENALKRMFCDIRGEKWEGGDVFDDYC